MLIDRRQFCRILAAGVLGCGFNSTGIDVDAASPFGRPLSDYLVRPLPAKLKAATVNPNLPTGISQLNTFQDFIDRQLVPGAVYVVGKNPVRAVASGIVHFIGEAKARGNKPRGYYVRVAHDIYDGLRQPFYPRVTLYRYQAYRSTYYYLSQIRVEHWQAIERGQVIGYGSRIEDAEEVSFKLVLEERGNPVNPDNFGHGHGFMRLRNRSSVVERTIEEMNQRLDGQIEIVRFLKSAFRGKDQEWLTNYIHCFTETEKFYDFPVLWSTVDKFRFLTDLYRKEPGRPASASPAQIERMVEEFKDLQPILLTLPFD